MGRPRSSQIVRPSQEQICLGFWKRPAERAMMPQANLFPEFPVILDKGWPPRPRSSSPSSITRLRPITSHTFEGKQQPRLHCPARRVPTLFPSHLQLFILYPEGSSATSFSPDIAQISPVLKWDPIGERKSYRLKRSPVTPFPRSEILGRKPPRCKDPAFPVRLNLFSYKPTAKLGFHPQSAELLSLPKPKCSGALGSLGQPPFPEAYAFFFLFFFLFFFFFFFFF